MKVLGCAPLRSPHGDSRHEVLRRCGAGTVRCHEAVTKLPGSYDIVINIQGDEPLMEPEIIDGVVRALQDTPDCNYRCAPCSQIRRSSHVRH